MASSKEEKLDDLPTEIMIQVIRELFSWTPEGKLRREDGSKSLLVGRELKPRVMSLPKLAVSETSWNLLKSVSVVLVDSQFIRINPSKVNILPIILAADVPLVCLGGAARRFPEHLLAVTHKIGKIRCEKGRGLRFSGNPWGLDEEGRRALSPAERTFPGPYIILRRDLERFCMGLQAADAGYRNFGHCTEHRLTFHEAAADSDTDIKSTGDPKADNQAPAATSSRDADAKSTVENKSGRRQLILNIYRENLTGFDDFKVGDASTAVQLDLVEDKHLHDPNTIHEDLRRRRRNGEDLVDGKRYREAAESYRGGAQQIMWLINRGMLNSPEWAGHPKRVHHLGGLKFDFLIRAAEANTDHVRRCLGDNADGAAEGAAGRSRSVTIDGEDAGGSRNEETTTIEVTSPVGVAPDPPVSESVYGPSSTGSDVAVFNTPDRESKRSRSQDQQFSGGPRHRKKRRVESEPRTEDYQPEASASPLVDEQMPDLLSQNDVSVDARVLQTVESQDPARETTCNGADARVNEGFLKTCMLVLEEAKKDLERVKGFLFGEEDVTPDNKQQVKVNELGQTVTELLDRLKQRGV